MKNKISVFLPEPCVKCGSGKGVVQITDTHKKLSCDRCGSYVKFIGKKDFLIDADNADDETIFLDEINFKLDLILDHLGIKQ